MDIFKSEERRQRQYAKDAASRMAPIRSLFSAGVGIFNLRTEEDRIARQAAADAKREKRWVRKLGVGKEIAAAGRARKTRRGWR